MTDDGLSHPAQCHERRRIALQQRPVIILEVDFRPPGGKRRLLQHPAAEPLAVCAGNMLVLAAQVDDDFDRIEVRPQQLGQPLDLVLLAQQPPDLLGRDDTAFRPIGQRGYLGVPFGPEPCQAGGLGHALPGAGMKAPQNTWVVDKARGQQRMVRPTGAARIVDAQCLHGRPLLGQHALDGAGAGFGQADMQDKVPLHAATLGS